MESNQKLSMSMFANKADYETAVAEMQNVASEKVVLDIKANPELVLQLKDGDTVSVDSTVFNVLDMVVHDLIYLITVDSRTEEYDEAYKDNNDLEGVEYKDYIQHLREKQTGGRVYGRAVMTREDMKKILESGNYYIG